MKEFYEVLFFSVETGKLLRRFKYPKNKVANKYFWEKMKHEELKKLSKSLILEERDIRVVDTTSEKQHKMTKIGPL